MNDVVEEMTAIRDATTVLLDVVCDSDLSLQGLMILEKIQIRLVHRQVQLIWKLRQQARRYETQYSKGIDR